MSLLSFLTLQAFKPDLDDPRYTLSERLKAHRVQRMHATIFGENKQTFAMEVSQGHWGVSSQAPVFANGAKDATPCFALLESKSVLCEVREFPGISGADAEAMFAEQAFSNPSSLLKGGLYEEGRAYHIVSMDMNRWALVFSVLDSDVIRAVDEIKKRTGSEPVGVVAGLAAATKCALHYVRAHSVSYGVVVVSSQKQVLLLLVKAGRVDHQVSLRSVEDTEGLHETQGYVQEELMNMELEGHEASGAILFTTPSSTLQAATLTGGSTPCTHVPLTTKDLCFA